MVLERPAGPEADWIRMKIAVALSGGVDSSVAAAKLVGQGHEVVGVTMRVWPDSKCCGIDALHDAAAVARKLGIQHHVVDLMDRFRQEVVDPFLETYADGRTPNPCPTCNQRLKFNYMWEAVRQLAGVERIATGHYARVRFDPATGMYQLLKGADRHKDQSYMLFKLDQAQLARLVTPLGEQSKEQTRAEAWELGLLYIADKPDSQDLCFTSDDLPGFLARHLPEREREGPIVARDGTEVGRHRGTIHYTVGQRRGLGIAAAEPLYVLDIDPQTHTVIVGPREQTYRPEIMVEDCCWTSVLPPVTGFRAEVKIRHSPHVLPAAIALEGERLRVRFDEPQPGIAAGQFAVFHQDDVVLGGGTICR